jgi:uncharacterized protein YdeI (YjbR/CyaY-like superfamily)
MNPKKRFKAVLELLPGGLKWTIVRIPFDAAKTWPKRNRMRVKGTINGIPIRTSLFAMGDGQMLLVNKQMQRQGQVFLGGTADIVLEPDLDERIPTVPPELAKLLKQDRALKKFYEELSPSSRSDIGKTISEPKSMESRRRRAEQLAERMLLTMEGEQVLPPILQIAFRRVPQAAAGWQAMTAAQRRSHLLGIFYYQSPEARERRAAKAVDEALRIAKTKTSKRQAHGEDSGSFEEP